MIAKCVFTFVFNHFEGLEKSTMRYWSVLFLAVVVGVLSCGKRAAATPEVPGAPQHRPIALVGGTVHPVSGPVIEGATLVFNDGKILAIGRDVAIPADAERIDVAGKHVYPGLIDANTQLGLIEVPSVRGSRDQA